MTEVPAHLRIAYYGDDFTGSTDALESLTRAGLRTVLYNHNAPYPKQLDEYERLDAIGVAGTSRSLEPQQMEGKLWQVFTDLMALKVPIIHYKVCSTFDSSPEIGSIGRVLDIARDRFKTSPFVPIIVGSPALGRFCAFGNLFARYGAEGDYFRLDRHPSISRHPITPMNEADLRLHLAKQTTKKIGLFDHPKLEKDIDSVRADLERILREEQPEAILFDVMTEPHLTKIGQLLEPYADPENPLFVIGSSGVGNAFGTWWAQSGQVSPRTEFETFSEASPMLVVSGSASPVTAGQIQYAVEHGFVEIPLDTASLAIQELERTELFWPEQTRVEQLALEAFSEGRNVVVHTARGPVDPRLSETEAVLRERGMSIQAIKSFGACLYGGALGSIASAAVNHQKIKRVCIAGGDTSGWATYGMCNGSLEMIAPFVTGAPLCRFVAPGSEKDGLEVNIKGGQVGSPDYFVKLQKGTKT